MTFTQAIRSVLSNFFKIEGRARRSEFWYWLAFFYVTNIILVVFGFFEIGMIWRLLLIIPTLTLSIRRLHDLDISGWWVLLLVLVPVFLPVIGIKKGTDGKNKYGEDPITDTGLGDDQNDSIVIR